MTLNARRQKQRISLGWHSRAFGTRFLRPLFTPFYVSLVSTSAVDRWRACRTRGQSPYASGRLCDMRTICAERSIAPCGSYCQRRCSSCSVPASRSPAEGSSSCQARPSLLRAYPRVVAARSWRAANGLATGHRGIGLDPRRAFGYFANPPTCLSPSAKHLARVSSSSARGCL